MVCSSFGRRLSTDPTKCWSVWKFWEKKAFEWKEQQWNMNCFFFFCFFVFILWQTQDHLSAVIHFSSRVYYVAVPEFMVWLVIKKQENNHNNNEYINDNNDNTLMCVSLNWTNEKQKMICKLNPVQWMMNETKIKKIKKYGKLQSFNNI